MSGVIFDKDGYQTHSLDTINHKTYDLILVFGGVERVPTKLPRQMHYLDEGAALIHDDKYHG